MEEAFAVATAVPKRPMLTLNQENIQHTVIKGNEAFAAALVADPPSPWARTQIMLYVFSVVGFFCSTMNGYDGSLINNLLINPAFLEYYHAENAGIWAGIISSMYQIGGVVALPFGKHSVGRAA